MDLYKMREDLKKIIQKETSFREKEWSLFCDMPETDEKKALRTKIAIYDEIDDKLWDLIYFIEDRIS